jgi:hypothetical protein
VNTPPNPLETARMRLEVLYADTSPNSPQPTPSDLSTKERQALRIVLDEVQRLNIAVSNQRKHLLTIFSQAAKKGKKRSARK